MMAPTRSEVVISYEPFGAAQQLFESRFPEILLSGPAGTGKSRGCLEKLHLCALKYGGMRGLIARKTLSSLTSTGLVTFREKVLHPLDGVSFFGGNKEEPAHYRYPNGSVLVVGGLDKTSKVMSSEYDGIYVQEATELVEREWEELTTRLRYGRMPYQQIFADCNPDLPTHWLLQRANRQTTLLLESRHEDNPTIYDRKVRTWTPEGARYIARLDALTGPRKERLRYGRWASAEGLVYESWDPRLHLVDPFPIPKEWPRYWACDFGYTHAFSFQWWARDPDGRLYLYREIYRTQRLVEDHAADVLRLSAGEPRPVALICDHDAEDRATLERHLKMPTTPAYKAVSPGIQAVASRLKVAGDGKPRLFLMRGALAEQDHDLADKHKPLCTEQEMSGYVWDTRAGRRKGEEPVKEDDHGMDALRYAVSYVDNINQVRRPFRAASAGERPAVADYASRQGRR